VRRFERKRGLRVSIFDLLGVATRPSVA
jgi:hypothetical protein